MRLYRSHGLGNDYLVLEDGTLTPARVRAICDRHTGVGSDGILEPVSPPEGARAAGVAYGLRIHNPDGTEAEKSGNGLRIYADWLVGFRGAPRMFRVWTPGGVVRCEVGEQVRVAMGVARVGGIERFERVRVGTGGAAGVERLEGVRGGEETGGAAGVERGTAVEAYPVDVGNPHRVVFGIPADWEAVGARIEHAVVGRTNVQFVEVIGPSTLRVRVWERGAGRTLSSGSSACAAAAAAVAHRQVLSPVTVEMEGGVLRVAVGPDGAVDLEGPVARIGRFEVDEGWLARA